MSFTTKEFAMPKRGEKKTQDSSYTNIDQLLFAIADGASDSAYQKLWADILVHGFINQPFNMDEIGSSFIEWLTSRQKEWHKSVPWSELNWQNENKSKMVGGLATFLAIHFLPNKQEWHGVAVGDCNMFHCTEELMLIESVPIRNSGDFDTMPNNLSSIKNPLAMIDNIDLIKGKYQPGDIIFLSTDALAEWILKEIERGQNPFPQLWKHGKNEFDVFISSLRRESRIKNDDVTLLVIDTGAYMDYGESLPPYSQDFSPVDLTTQGMFTVNQYRTSDISTSAPRQSPTQDTERVKTGSKKTFTRGRGGSGQKIRLSTPQIRNHIASIARNSILIIFIAMFGFIIGVIWQKGQMPSRTVNDLQDALLQQALASQPPSMDLLEAVVALNPHSPGGLLAAEVIQQSILSPLSPTIESVQQTPESNITTTPLNDDTFTPSVLATPTRQTVPTVRDGNDRTVDYTIRSGDTLETIAEQFSISVNELLRYNPQVINPNTIEIGEILKIPLP